MALALIQTAAILFDAVWWVLVIQMILSWLIAFNIINTHNEAIRAVWIALDRLTEPLYRPIRKIMPDLGALDLSPLVVLIILRILRGPGLTALYSLIG